MQRHVSELRRRVLRKNDESGFTLIELLIVIVVLGILAAVVVFALGGITGQSAVAACNSDAKTVSIAVSAYEAQNPGTTPTLISTLVPTYLKSVPSNPSYYALSLDSNGYVQVALNGSDPGAKAASNPNAPTTGATAEPTSPGTFPWEVEGTQALTTTPSAGGPNGVYAWDTGNTVGVTTGLPNANVCLGA